MDNSKGESRSLTCSFCSETELRSFGRNFLRCDECGGVLGSALLETLYMIVTLPDAAGGHACECGHPEMRRLPDGVYRCPACKSEVTPITAPVSWKSPDHTEEYWPPRRPRSPSAKDQARRSLVTLRSPRADHQIVATHPGCCIVEAVRYVRLEIQRIAFA